jgi:hypothetical protein
MTHLNNQKDSAIMRIKRNKFVILFFVLLLLFISFVSGTLAAPKKVTTARAGDCKACHGSEMVLPGDHAGTNTMNYAGCVACHPKTGKGSLRTKMPSSHAHNLAGVTCEKCHGKGKKPKPLEMKQCITCHDPGKLVEKTAKVKPENPHTSPHYGNSLDCNLCHHQHEKSENYCNQCHKFDFIVP